ncbi:U-box domain-containing protein 15 isoform 1 [Tripterygium wilfordii]|uniref:RING-type E3 ubiquitin transferase n=1 Tax=Tripterygium wilfordii TaxID=458696 RepID=A0A7J7DHN2_TRIWF|nr:U-box domain-containing protein 15-like [Tripterygium wilfordii]KAF5745808.1 U-box domain-containing protein 15 isoform 1 [Tripterygium wilfordii]
MEGYKGNDSISSTGAYETELVGELMQVIETVGSYSGFRRTQRKECLNLVRRLKLLMPLLEEIIETDKVSVLNEAFDCLDGLNKALLGAKRLLKDCCYGSKIYLALESEAVMSRFHGVYDKLNQALDGIPYQELGISVEVKEQVELMRMQLKRAKKRTDTQDMELAMDMMVVFSQRDDRNADSAILERLAIKLELHSIVDLKAETVAVRKLVKKRGSHNAEGIQHTLQLLDKFRKIAGVNENNVLDTPISLKSLQRCQSLLIPHEFLCPITLEIMTDPVIVATGQTYERESIEKWLNSNHRTCPKTGQTLDHLSLAPNYALRNLILQWCEKNDYELPKKHSHGGSGGSLVKEISSLIHNLTSCQPDVSREAIVKIRMLSKENPDNRIVIANNGAIPILVKLLFYPDSQIQEHAVTSLLNLSIDEANKRLIAREGAIPAIIEVLQNGMDAARENSAASLFSLSVLDENKVLVGSLNGIPPLVDLLQNGTIRGKKDAATALFNLSLNQANKTRAIKAGIVPALLRLLEDKNLDMIDEALSILLLLASHPAGRNEMGSMSLIKTLVEIIKNGSPKNKECGTAVLLELGVNSSSFTLAALQYGVYEDLVELGRCGTSRAQRKANSLLQHMSKCEHIPFNLMK